jgi:hypothetical protein
MKGLSQVITSALILAVGISVAGVYANWAPDLAEGIAGETAEQQNQNLKCRNAGLRINSAEYSLSGNFTDIEVTNIGTVDLRNGLTAASFNQSRTIGKTDFSQIEVDATRNIRVESDEIPEEVGVFSSECGEDVDASTQDIKTE